MKTIIKKQNRNWLYAAIAFILFIIWFLWWFFRSKTTNLTVESTTTVSNIPVTAFASGTPVYSGTTPTGGSSTPVPTSSLLSTDAGQEATIGTDSKILIDPDVEIRDAFNNPIAEAFTL